MRLEKEAALFCVAVTAMLLYFGIPGLEITAMASAPSIKVSSSKVTAEGVQETISRVRRQTRNRGIFSLIYDYIVETRDDTMKAFNQISSLVQSQIVPKPQGIQLNTTDPELAKETPDDNNTMTTTEQSYLLTQDEFFRLVRRNLRGLARLFNTESRKAIKDSSNNVKVLRKQLRDVVRPFVQPVNSTA